MFKKIQKVLHYNILKLHIGKKRQWFRTLVMIRTGMASPVFCYVDRTSLVLQFAITKLEPLKVVLCNSRGQYYIVKTGDVSLRCCCQSATLTLTLTLTLNPNPNPNLCNTFTKNNPCALLSRFKKDYFQWFKPCDGGINHKVYTYTQILYRCKSRPSKQKSLI